jgi:hypothetical protein
MQRTLRRTPWSPSLPLTDNILFSIRNLSSGSHTIVIQPGPQQVNGAWQQLDLDATTVFDDLPAGYVSLCTAGKAFFAQNS